MNWRRGLIRLWIVATMGWWVAMIWVGPSIWVPSELMLPSITVVLAFAIAVPLIALGLGGLVVCAILGFDRNTSKWI